MKSHDSNISAIDLFCGVGGLTHGLVQGGIDVIAGVDLNPSCRYPFEANNSAMFLKEDVGSLAPARLKELWSGSSIRVLAGCAPCQPFSTYSRSGRGGNYDTQWPLLLAFARLIKESKPEIVTMENVPQVMQHSVFHEFLSVLGGYEKWWSIVECASLGIPQTRKRLVLIASRLGSEGLDLGAFKGANSTVQTAIGSLAPIQAGQADPNDPLHVASSLSDVNLCRIRASRPGGTWRDWPSSLLAECHKKQTGATYPSVYGRMEWDKPSPTITTQCFGYGNGRFGHPDQDRAISLREAAILQTFPSDYKFASKQEEIKFSTMGRLIGNAVPVRLGQAIGEVIMQHVSHYC